MKNGSIVNVKDFGYGTIVLIDEDEEKVNIKHLDRISKGQIREYPKEEITLKTTLGRQEEDNVVEEYKGYDIVKHEEDCFEVVGDDTRFIVGLDDSKSSGRRIAVPVKIENARAYIDYITK